MRVDLRLYALVDPERSVGRDLAVLARLVAQGGATLVQLRDKHSDTRAMVARARAIKAALAPLNVPLLINDRIDVALACGAEGVHLGQDDLPLSAGRALMGEKFIGISTHNLDQAREAERNGADYIGFGPMFGTATKVTGYEARGLEMLQQIRRAVKLPIVAIGGITEENVREIWQAGADSAAIISDILRADDIATKTRRFTAVYGEDK